jgi:DNA polymerase III gamma/tau subunit
LRGLAETARAHDPAQLARVFELLQDAEEEVAKAATPRHALEVALLRAVHLAPSGSLPELVEKVDRAFAKLGGERPAPPAGARLQREVVSSARTAVAEPESRAPASVLAPPANSGPPANPTVEDRWRTLISAVKSARKMSQAAALEKGVPLRIGPGTVVVGFRSPNDALALEDADSRRGVEAVFAGVLGSPVKLVVERVPAEAAVESVAEEKERAKGERKGKRLQQGREHPAVRAAVEVLGGEIEDVRDLGEE